MYCITCELEIKGDDKETCPVCGGVLSDSQEADNVSDNQDREEETGGEAIFNDSESSAVFEQEPASDASGQEEVFVLKDYDPDSLNAVPAVTSSMGSDELPLLNEPAQGSTDNMDDLLDSIRQSIATPEHSEDEGVSAAEESPVLDSDFSFFDSDGPETSMTVPSDKTIEKETEVSWGFDAAADAVSMPVAPERKRSSAFQIILIIVLFVVGGYYAFTLISDDAGSDDDATVRTVMPLAALKTEKKQEQSARETATVSDAEVVEESSPAGEELIQPLADVDGMQAAESDSQMSAAPVEPEALAAAAPVVDEDAASAPAVPAAVETPAPIEPEELAASAPVVDEVAASAPVVPAAVETPAPVAKQISAPFFTVHVGSYRKQGSAATEVDRIKAKGYDAFVERVALGKKGIWYRVKVGRFANRAEAEKLQKKINKVLVSDSMVVTHRTN